MMKRLWGFLAAVALLPVASSAAFAQQAEVTLHRAKSGDTLQLLAAEYYGSRSWAVLIMKVNGIEHDRKLRRREKLKMPISRPITVNVGDTLAELAEVHLGDVRRAPFLARFNNLAPDASVPAGYPLVVPYHMTHVAASNVSLSSLAATFLNDRRKGRLIREYNFLDKNTLAKGQSVIIPLHTLQVKPSKLPPPDPESAARRGKRIEMQARAARALRQAESAWRSGDYNKVKQAFTDPDSIETAYLDPAEAVAVHVFLGGAEVASGDNASALRFFKQALERNPDHALRAYDYSPKIRKVWEQAGGTVSGEPR